MKRGIALTSEAKIIRINYYEGDVLRFLKGRLLEEDTNFVKVELDNYIVTISKDHIVKMEVSKRRG
jgi:hypothetical protein